MGTALCTKYAVEQMRRPGRSGRERGSVHGFVGQPDICLCRHQGGALQMSRNMAVELGSFNIRVNCVCPGAVLTEHTFTD